MEGHKTKNRMVLLKADHNHESNLMKISRIEDIFDTFQEDICVQFKNEILPCDLKFVKHKLKQAKKQKNKRVLLSCTKVLKDHPNHLWSYMMAGATCRRYEKHMHDVPYYFSQAVLINPNCITAWLCLARYIKENPLVGNLAVSAVVSGLLLLDSNNERWPPLIKDLLSNTSCSMSLLTPFLDYGDPQKQQILSEMVADCFLLDRKFPSEINEANMVLSAVSRSSRCRKDISYLSRILSCLLTCGNYDMFNKFVVLENYILDYKVNVHFFQRLLRLLTWTGGKSSNGIVQSVVLLPYKLRVTRRYYRSYLNIIYAAYGDYRRVQDNYLVMIKQGSYLKSIDRLLGLWSAVKMGQYELALCELENGMESFKKTRRRLRTYKVAMLNQAYRDILIYFLTHGPTVPMRKLGLLLCLRIMRDGESSLQTLYYACIACIGLEKFEMAKRLLPKLIDAGGINEVLFLKCLLDGKPSHFILKEMNEFISSHLLLSAFYAKSGKMNRALKAVSKASVFVPCNYQMYEWLGIYYHEMGEYKRARKYFKTALFYNNSSWTSINYYSYFLEMAEKESSKKFLDLFLKLNNSNYYTYAYLIAFKAGVCYLNHQSNHYDFYKACENLRRALYIYKFLISRKRKLLSEDEEDNSKIFMRYLVEMLGEAYSLYGMVGVGINWLKECFFDEECVFNKEHEINVYAGTQLGRLYLFTKGVSKYLNQMRFILRRNVLDTYVALYNAAYALYLKSLKLYMKNKQHLSQVYCQKGVLLCARALSMHSHFQPTWKLMGDFLCICGKLNYKAGFLFIPNWLAHTSSPERIVLIRRAGALQLALRCYFTAADLPECSSQMKACLWGSIAFAYLNLSNFVSLEKKKPILKSAIDCCIKALNENAFDSVTWNTLGVLILKYGFSDEIKEIVHTFSKIAFTSSSKLSYLTMCRLKAICNLGFLCLMRMEYEEAYYSLLSARGTCTALEKPWIGQILLHLCQGAKIREIMGFIQFLYLYTYHHPSINLMVFYCLLLQQYGFPYTREAYSKKYLHCCQRSHSNLYDSLLSIIIHGKKGALMSSQIDLIYATRTFAGTKCDVYSALIKEFMQVQSTDNKPRFKGHN